MCAAEVHLRPGEFSLSVFRFWGEDIAFEVRQDFENQRGVESNS